MKKGYVKPVFTFESFALSKNIAAGCEYIMNFDPDSCVVEVFSAGRKVAIFQNSFCAKTPGPNDKICYDNPAPDSNIFSS